MFQISTIANFETDHVYELLKLFDLSGSKHDKKISNNNIALQPPSWSKLTILP